jgi:ethanolamine utilization protein EutA
MTTPRVDDEFVFSAIDRKAGAEDELVLTSVGIDIGSSTSHLIFSQLILER